MLEYVDLTNWKHKDVIIKELFMQNFLVSERELRREIKKYNARFYNHEIDTFIVHSNSKGYKLTKDVEEIKESIKDNRKRALNMLYEESKIRKAIGENYNLQLIIKDNEFIAIES